MSEAGRSSREVVEASIDLSKEDKDSTWEEMARSSSYRWVQRWDAGARRPEPEEVEAES